MGKRTARELDTSIHSGKEGRKEKQVWRGAAHDGGVSQINSAMDACFLLYCMTTVHAGIPHTAFSILVRSAE